MGKQKEIDYLTLVEIAWEGLKSAEIYGKLNFSREREGLNKVHDFLQKSIKLRDDVRQHAVEMQKSDNPNIKQLGRILQRDILGEVKE